MKELNIMTMKKKDFETVPRRKTWAEKLPLFDSIVIIPTKNKHDSGFLCMEFVGCKGHTPIVRAGGCSDVIHIDGIGGCGDLDHNEGAPTSVPPKGWSVDCLPCGYLRVFALFGYALRMGHDLSDFEIVGVKRNSKRK